MSMVLVLMGVAGSGKTTIGARLGAELGWRFIDADDFHPAANVEKMASGQPLDDADRAPWLAALHAALVAETAAGRSVVLACSALKAAYRRALVGGGPDSGDAVVVPVPARFVYLQGSPALLRQRLRSRTDHFMREHLLDSQLDTLEEPGDALVIDIAESPRRIVEKIRVGLGLGLGPGLGLGSGGAGDPPGGVPPHT